MRKRRRSSKGSRWKIRVRRYGGWREKRCAKIDGELPFEHQKQLASQQDPHAPVPTDQKLAKLRELDQKLQNQER